jgi:hypothetical protein
MPDSARATDPGKLITIAIKPSTPGATANVTISLHASGEHVFPLLAQTRLNWSVDLIKETERPMTTTAVMAYHFCVSGELRVGFNVHPDSSLVKVAVHTFTTSVHRFAGCNLESFSAASAARPVAPTLRSMMASDHTQRDRPKTLLNIERIVKVSCL